MNSRHLYTSIVSLFFAIVLLSCSTEKNTFVNRNFHNLTAHYNVYFNGKEAMKNGLYKVESQMEEDYSKILPVFKESLPGTESMVKSDMNTSVEKGMKLIKLHSITKPPQSNRKQKNPRKRKPVKPEYNKWVDNAYLMMGRAYLYQKDYIRAISTFQQVIRKYKDSPVKYEAYLWLVRTYAESERYTEARELVEALEGNDQFPEKLEGDLAINAADMHLKQQHFDEAIQYLNIGIKKIKGNKRKTRYTYILAQLYQETGNAEQALEAYHQVIRRRPDYKMLFNAQINSASVFSGDGDASLLRKELNKMLKKKRNSNFLDQIYFALGNIAYNEGQITDGIDYYIKSAAVSVDNTYQRAQSCLTLADIYFDQRNYIPSGMYYDSAMAVIDQNYPNFEAISEKHGNMNRLVTNLLEVEKQDSLQALAALSPNELDAKIANWIAEETRKQEALAEKEGEINEYDQAYGRATSNRMRIGNTGGGWYFYNPSTVSYGKKEFGRIWGNRKNEDNWRRINKSETMLDEFGEPVEDLTELLEEEAEPRIDDPTTKEYYLQDIPNNDSLMAVSHDNIRDALFNAGNIFRTDFNDMERSIECFRELNRRYPENIYELPSYFSLWDLYTTVENTDSAGYFKNEILDKYPDSNYAKYLNNPNYFIEEEARKDSMNQLYSLAFNAYQSRNFNQALQYSNQVEKMNPDSTLMPKLKFIQLVAGSRNLDQKQFAQALSDYLENYPSDDIAKLANQILDLIGEEKLTDYEKLVDTGYLNEVIKNLELLPQNTSEEDPFANKWDEDTELLHYFVIAVPNDEDLDINRLKYDIANYNIDHYTTIDFDIETENLNNETKLIVVRNFNNKESALIYFLSIIRKTQVFKTLAGVKFLNFIVSNNNFREMLTDRTYEEYLRFFVKNYSSYTSGEFLDEELDAPEELMAKLNQEEEEFEERGEFVVVETDAEDIPVKEELFKLDYNALHQVMVLINEQRYRTGVFMRDLVRYNARNHRNKRLRAVPANLDTTTVMLITSFENAQEAEAYKETISKNESLFSNLGEVAYSIYTISEANFTQLKTTSNIAEWEDFYRKYYIYRKPPKVVEASIDETENDGATNNETEKEATTNADHSETINTDEVSDSQTTDGGSTNIEGTNDQTESIDTPQPETEGNVTDSGYQGPFTHNPEVMHNLVYLLPTSGSNKNLLITYVTRFNAMKYRSFGLEVSSDVFDDFRSSVLISGIGTQEKATEYYNAVLNDSRVKMSLRNVNYKCYLISNENLEILRRSKDIAAYQEFYSNYYEE